MGTEEGRVSHRAPLSHERSSSQLHGNQIRRFEQFKQQPPNAVPYTPAAPTSDVFGELPPFNPMSTPIFKWGARDADDFIKDVEQAYRTVTKWRKNVFKLPSGSSGKHFVQALAHLIASYGERSPLECIALKGAAILAPLLLQQPMGKSTYRENIEHLTRRLKAMGRRQHQGAAQRRRHDPSAAQSQQQSSR